MVLFLFFFGCCLFGSFLFVLVSFGVLFCCVVGLFRAFYVEDWDKTDQKNL